LPCISKKGIIEKAFIKIDAGPEIRTCKKKNSF